MCASSRTTQNLKEVIQVDIHYDCVVSCAILDWRVLLFWDVLLMVILNFFVLCIHLYNSVFCTAKSIENAQPLLMHS